MIRSFQGTTPIIHETAFVAETAVVIGDVTMGPQSSIWYNCVARGDVNFIRIGARSNVQDLSMLHVTHRKHPDDPGAPLVIGDDVTIGHCVTLHGCTIKDGAFVGMQAMIMDRAVIGEGALIGARALITEGTIVPPHTLWMGAPATCRRELTQEERDWLRHFPVNYVRYSDQYRTDHNPQAKQ